MGTYLYCLEPLKCERNRLLLREFEASLNLFYDIKEKLTAASEVVCVPTLAVGVFPDDKMALVDC